MDTDVLVAALDSPTSASRRLLLAVLDGRARLLLSTPLLLEYEAVLLRPRVLAMAGTGVEEVLAVLDELASIGVPVAFDHRWRPVARDSDDDLALETAVNGGAETIASLNLADMAPAASASPSSGPGPCCGGSRGEQLPPPAAGRSEERATAQAEAAGVSLNQYIATALAARVGAQAEAERALTARGARAKPGRAREILSRAGRRREPRAADRLDEDQR